MGEADEYPHDVFWLPTACIGYYDDPDAGQGDDGWDPDAIAASLSTYGQAMPLAVGMSLHDMAASGDHSVCSFNGNHRLQVLKRIGIPFAMCENSAADDAEPLTVSAILALGGTLSRPASIPYVDFAKVAWWEPPAEINPAP